MTEPDFKTCPDSPSAPVDESRARLLGDRLRQAFDEVIAEPLPVAFADLLRQLE